MTATTGTESTRQRLLEAAAHEFAEHGFAGASVRDICARAQANVAAINYHFGGKEQIYAEVLRLPMRLLDDSIPGFSTAGLTLTEALRLMFLGMLAPLRGGSAEAAAMRLAAQAFSAPGSDRPKPDMAVVQRHHAALLALLRRHLPRGVADATVQVLAGALIGMAMHAVMDSLHRHDLPAMSTADDERGIEALAVRLGRYGVAIVASEVSS